MPYADKTKVPVTRTKTEIEEVLKKYGATQFAFASEEGRAVIMFAASERRIRFELPLPKLKSIEATEKEERRRWRALFLCIKAKLESVASGIETFEEAFLAHVVLPDGGTVWQHAKPTVQQAYLTGRLPPLLPDYSRD